MTSIPTNGKLQLQSNDIMQCIIYLTLKNRLLSAAEGKDSSKFDLSKYAPSLYS